MDWGWQERIPNLAPIIFTSTGGTVYARNNSTGAIDSSGTDLRVVWDAVVALTPNGGRFYFKNGIYPCNSLDLESTGGFSNYYCIGIPGGIGSGQYAEWFLEGESNSPQIDEFGTGVQTASGVIFHLTPTAVSSVAAHSKIMIIWARPDTVLGVGAFIGEKNFDLRVPTNQRGCETASSLINGLAVDYDNVSADTDVAEASLVFPVEDGSCASWGATDSGGLVGLTTTGSVKESQWMKRVSTIGYDVGLDVESEHTILEHAYGVRGNHGIDYGVHGGTITHTSVWLSAGCGEVARCLTLGANLALGSALTVWSFDMEDACNSGGACAGASYLPVYHAIETNVGNTNGIISFSSAFQGNQYLQDLPNLWDGGGGSNFLQIQATSAHNIQRTVASDTFARPNTTPTTGALGPGWQTVDPTHVYSIGLEIHSNTVTPPLTSNFDGTSVYGGQTVGNDQIAAVVIGAVDATGYVGPTVRQSTSAQTSYEYLCVHGTTTQITKYVAGSGATLINKTETCAATDSMEIHVFGASPAYLQTYHNGKLDLVWSDSSSPIASGGVGIDIYSPTTLGGDSASYWTGGTLPTINGINAESTFSAFFPTYNTNSNCAAVGTAASPSVASCGSAAAGQFSCATNATGATCTVNTTVVTANSEIFVLDSDTTVTGTRLGVTCNTSTAIDPTSRLLASSVAGTSFTINLGTVTTNPACFSYYIIN